MVVSLWHFTIAGFETCICGGLFHSNITEKRKKRKERNSLDVLITEKSDYLVHVNYKTHKHAVTCSMQQ